MSKSVSLQHKRRICILYKEALRTLQSWYDYRPAFRYYAILLRDRFAKNANLSEKEGARLAMEGEQELFEKQHYDRLRFAQSPRGSAFSRECIPPDWVLDYWHPLEKAQYAEFFANREMRKKEYIRFWTKQYGSKNAKSD